MTSLKDVGESVVGAAAIAASLVTPILRRWRVRWGATGEEVHRKMLLGIKQRAEAAYQRRVVNQNQRGMYAYN